MTEDLLGARPPLDGTPPTSWRNTEDLRQADLAASNSARLDGALLRGFAWTAGARWTSQVLSWASTLVVANVLNPVDYGIVGMSVLVLNIVSLINEFGVTTAIVTLRELPEEDLRRLNAFALSFGVLCFAVGAILAIPIGAYFHVPVLPTVILVQSTGFILSSLQSVPSAVLQRDLSFKRLASVDLARSFVASLAALTLALLGARYWSLVGAELLAATTQTALLIAMRPTGYLWSGFTRVRHAIVFGSRTVVERLSWYTYSNADFAVAGRMLGASALGAYSFAWTLVSLPVEKISSLLGRVTPTVLAASSHDVMEMRRYVLGITEGLALLTVPATAGIALTAADFIPLAFGQKWQMAILPLQLLSVCAALRSITPVLVNAMTARRDIRFLMWNGIASAIVLPISFYVGGRIAGIQGIAFAWLVIYPLSTLPLYWRAISTRVISARSYLTALAPSAECTLIMSVSVLGTRWAGMVALHQPSLLLRFVAEVVVGVLAYVIALRVRYPARARAAVAVLRRKSSTQALATS